MFADVVVSASFQVRLWKMKGAYKESDRGCILRVADDEFQRDYKSKKTLTDIEDTNCRIEQKTNQ